VILGFESHKTHANILLSDVSGSLPECGQDRKGQNRTDSVHILSFVVVQPRNGPHNNFFGCICYSGNVSTRRCLGMTASPSSAIPPFRCFFNDSVMILFGRIKCRDKNKSFSVYDFSNGNLPYRRRHPLVYAIMLRCYAVLQLCLPNNN
jgi:hypothetical protein